MLIGLKHSSVWWTRRVNAESEIVRRGQRCRGWTEIDCVLSPTRVLMSWMWISSTSSFSLTDSRFIKILKNYPEVNCSDIQVIIAGIVFMETEWISRGGLLLVVIVTETSRWPFYCRLWISHSECVCGVQGAAITSPWLLRLSKTQLRTSWERTGFRMLSVTPRPQENDEITVF